MSTINQTLNSVISLTNTSPYSDVQPTLKKFWVEIVGVLDLDTDTPPGGRFSYLENLTTETSVSANYATIAEFQNTNVAEYPYYEYNNWIFYSQGRTNGGVQLPFAWEDGVWHLRTDIRGNYEDDNFYIQTSDAYLILTESLDCCITKYSSKLACNCSEKALAKATKMITYRDMAYRAFDAGDYNNASILIRKATELCNSTGCNCGCN
jgi:hypothetical protein